MQSVVINHPLAPTAVQISNLRASRTRVSWLSLSELDTARYIVYRSDGVVDGYLIPPNATLLGSLFARGPGNYVLPAPAASSAQSTYWLVEQTNNGETRVIGRAVASDMFTYLPTLLR